MQYTAPDGHIIESSPDGPVVYTCPQSGMILGTFNSLETESADSIFGIQQIKVNRYVTPTDITITITESTDAELQAYLDSIIRENERLSQLTTNDLIN
jgi:hypothetical protein